MPISYEWIKIPDTPDTLVPTSSLHEEKKRERKKLKLLVVLSGGQDSTTCLFWSITKPDVDFVGAVSFDYGQRHSRELDSAAFVYELARIEALKLNIFMSKYRSVKRLGSIFEGSSPLTNKDIPLETYKDFSEMDAKLTDRIEHTFVPGRNAVFIALAFSYAVAWGFDAIVLGVNGADTANYPDCTPEFVIAMQEAMQLATRSKVEIFTPLQGASKADIVRLAREFPGCSNALAFTTTDYDGEYPPGINHASLLRDHGFKEAGIPDPLIVRAKAEGLM